MRKISRKGEIQTEWLACRRAFDAEDMRLFIQTFYELILSQKVKFPLLEYCAEEIHNFLPSNIQIPFCDAIEAQKTEGGNVILGKILQLRLPQHFSQSVEKATEYISQADTWYVCDIIGERVFGFALLHYPNKMLAEYRKLSSHSSNWVVRSLGTGGHYAIKKGLGKKNVRSLFELLLAMSKSNDKEVRQGVGWAAKTTAKFHPDLISEYQARLESSDGVANWFRKKIDMGLNHNRHGKRS